VISNNIHSTLTHIHCSIRLSLRLDGYTYCWSALPFHKNHYCLLPRSDFTQNSRKPKNESKYPAPPGGSTSPARRLISKPRKIAKTLCVAWRPGMCRQAVPLPGTQNTRNSMSRLAVVHHPPGGFWKISETQNYKGFNSTQTTNIPYSYTLLIHP